MKTIINQIRLAAAFAVAICAAMPSFAADRTISANYTLTADETVDGVLTVPSGVTVDLNGHHLTVQGLAGEGTITCDPDFVLPDLTAPDPNGERVTWSTTNGTQTTTGSTSGLNLFNNNYTWAQNGTQRIVVPKSAWPLDVIYDFGEGTPQKVDRYRIYFGCAGTNYKKRGPRDWTFAGSNDKTNWTTLDTRSGVTWSNTTDTKNRDYDIDSSKVAEYRYYRIEFTASSATDYLELVQLEYFDTSVQPELHIAVPQGGTSTNSTVEIAGTVRLVKDGSGEFVTSKAGQTYTGGTLLSEGTLGLAGTASLDWSAFTLGTNPAKPVMLDFGPTAALSPVPATWNIGNVANVTSTVVKAGGDWTFSGDVRVGSGAGSVASFYHNGGTISAARLMVGDDNNTGHSGAGYCEISGGTITCSSTPIVGVYSEGNLVVTNSGSLVTTANSLYLGYQTAGTLTVADGGSVNLAVSVIMCYNSINASGVLNIGRGGVVSAQNAYRSKTGTATLNFDGGTFRKSSGNGNFFSPTGNDSAINVTVSANGGTLDNNALPVALPCTITGAGGMTLSGSGKTTVSADQSYLGTTTVSNGTTLAVSGGVTFAGPVAFAAGSALDIADYVGGVTPLTSTSLAFPASGTVPLTFNGGAFPVGVYAICSASGLTATDGEKFSVSAGDFNTLWSVEDGALVLSVIATTQTWNGAAGESASWNGSGWSGGAWADNADAVFATEGAIASVDSDVAANSVTFNAGATVNGSATLTPNVVFVAEGKEATINAPTAGALEKTGAGTLTLTESRTAATTVTAGTLKMDGATLPNFTLGTDGGAPVVFDYGGQALQKNPADYLVTGSDVTLTNGTFWMSGAMSIRDSTKIPSVLTIAKDATLRQTGANSFFIVKDNGTATVNVVGGTLGKTSSNQSSYLQHASDNGRLNINVTDGGLLTFNHKLWALCEGTAGISPSLYMMFSDSAFRVGNDFNFGNATTPDTLPTNPTGVFAATNSVVDIGNSFAVGCSDNTDKTGGSFTVDFEHCVVTTRWFAVNNDRPLNNARFNNTRLVFRNTGAIAARTGADNWITVGADGMTFDTQNLSCDLSANLGGSGAVTKVGTGTLTVFSNQTASAAFNVNEGTFAINGGVSVSRPMTIASGATLTVNATDTATIDALALEAGSTLNIASYDGTTPFAVATSATLPDEGTVNLTLNGGAFPVGVYAICSASGLTAADGAKFAPSTGDETANWSVEDNTLVLTVGYVDPNAWTGRGGDGRMSNGANWGGGEVPAAGADIDLSGISADTTLIADAGRTFGAVTMGTGVITFTNSFAATSFVAADGGPNPTAKISVAADSTVTLDGDLTFATSATVYICNSIAEGGVFAVTGDIIGTANQSGWLAACVDTSIEGTISARGLVSNCTSNDRFGLARGLAGSRVQWLIGDHGISGTSRFAIGNKNNVVATITAATNFTISASIYQYRALTLNTAGYEITLGTNTLAQSGGVIGNKDGPYSLTTVTGSGRVVVNYNVNDIAENGANKTNAFTVANGATLAFNPGGNIGPGALTVQNGGTLEIQSGTTTFGNLTIEGNAILGFNFTDRRVVPQLALYDGAEVTAMDPFTVKVSSANGLWPSHGEKQLTTCGGFDGIPLTLSAVGDAARWAKQENLSVNAAGNIVLDIIPKGLTIIFR